HMSRAVSLWDADTGRELWTRQGPEGNVYEFVAFSPDGRRFATSTIAAAGVVCLWDAATGERVLTLGPLAEPVRAVAFTPDGRRPGGGRIATASFDRTVKLWDAATGQEVLTLHDHARRTYGVAFSPDGSRLASSGDHAVFIHDAAPWAGRTVERPTLVLPGTD